MLAAQRVGPAGYMLATDISAGMLEAAAEAAHQAGLANVESRVMDARQLDLLSDAFDAAISQLLIMLVPEPREVVAEIRRVLTPGGRLAAIGFSTPPTEPRYLDPADDRTTAAQPPRPGSD